MIRYVITSDRKLSVLLHFAFALEAILFMTLTAYATATAQSGYPCYFESISLISILVSLFEIGSNLIICGLNIGSDVYMAVEW